MLSAVLKMLIGSFVPMMSAALEVLLYFVLFYLILLELMLATLGELSLKICYCAVWKNIFGWAAAMAATAGKVRLL